jgi:energy-coupling factor transporter ATP-binding protein EcfA2
MSDGEKQVLCLICDIGALSPQKSLVVVDEPELNLHPSLAMNLWNAIEGMRSEAVFVYATHSLSFAMRPNVTDVVILRDPKLPPVHLTSPVKWSSEELLPFLGSIAAVIPSGRLIAVEGTDKSFDRDFYAWIVEPSISVAAVGNSHSVRGAVMHHGVWEAVGDLKIAGIVDRDFKTDAQIKEIEASGCYVLAYHEAESYLCHPTLLAAAVKYSGKKELAENDFVERLAQQCEGHLLGVAKTRTKEASIIKLEIGPDAANKGSKDLASMRAAIESWANKELPRADNYTESVLKLFDAEYAKCKAAIDSRNIDARLALFPGKEILANLANYAGFGDSTRLLASVAENLSAKQFPHLIQVGESASANLSI